jgi:hypothetical protein
MLDIVKIEDGEDLGLANSIAPKAANLISTQIGSLEYAQNFGVDLKFFIESPIEFQNDAFKAYLVERLTQSQINVAEVAEVLESLYSRFTFKVGEIAKSEGFIA